jgi:hypothetical protein
MIVKQSHMSTEAVYLTVAWQRVFGVRYRWTPR